ncbi:hypothetical protein DVP43_04880 [Yersinia enterocolitica]|uniref:hypothetical protein n=2 Tax=Yersinia enterocolitica TaxID=630 RepID=UPI0005DFB42A|nr:hypothetical protein [Yersinia enterocolitica]EKN5936531.1 hypothetical protein [Yersinia enterocolitica]EKN6051942.1 hypothetical protein [Yersinia enterocolitica]CQJ58350.1 Uncharacterised protein [Yersinia enterocolitica]HDL7229737.1 hypothetical protein [Yersinia enterocolitica]HDL7459708.1 hypothetical protein [Yersinia enterocolitica]
MRRFIMLSLSGVTLLIPAVSSALDVYGEIHPERYTFFLNDKGGDNLKRLNNKMVSAIGKVRPGNMQDALNMSNLQKEGYDSVGIASFVPESVQKSTVRDDDQPVKAVTCLMSTVTVPHASRHITMERTWCKDEVGAEYIGFNGWPLRSAIAKSCRVGDNDCPVYLTLQNDDPTVRDDSVNFVPVHPPKPQALPEPAPKETDPAIVSKVVADLKANGCAIINKYKQSPPQCGSVIEVVTGKGMDREGIRSYEIDYAEAGTGWRVQWPVKLTYRGTTLIRFKGGDSFDAVDIEDPTNNQPSITSTQSSAWKMARNESSIIFTTENESGTQLELACGENGDFAVRYGTEGHWTSSGPMSQLTLKVGADEFSPDQTFFELLSHLPPSSKIVVLQMGHEYGSFSSHGLSELLKGISWKQCLNPQSSI